MVVGLIRKPYQSFFLVLATAGRFVCCVCSDAGVSSPSVGVRARKREDSKARSLDTTRRVISPQRAIVSRAQTEQISDLLVKLKQTSNK
ncbi:hypothetical protein J6590_047210 [Homalodisca vitripennis]|nr:hypothetical protein J6590_047210 [Homalodisca vitripennis]